MLKKVEFSTPNFLQKLSFCAKMHQKCEKNVPICTKIKRKKRKKESAPKAIELLLLLVTKTCVFFYEQMKCEKGRKD